MKFKQKCQSYIKVYKTKNALLNLPKISISTKISPRLLEDGAVKKLLDGTRGKLSSEQEKQAQKEK